MLDFMLETYDYLLESLNMSGRRFITVSEYLKRPRKAKTKSVVVLRHDVDRFVGHARKMAELENRLRVRSTYYFRYPATFEPQIVANVYEMGHEIGIHYECLDQAKGDLRIAKKLLKQQLREMRKIVPVRTAAMHGNPLSKIDNRELFIKINLKEFGLVGEAYLGVDFGKILYLTDTGRNWLADKYNLRDKPVAGSLPRPKIVSTYELIGLINNGLDGDLYINTHPERWSSDYVDWVVSCSKDVVVNATKAMIKKCRSNNFK